MILAIGWKSLIFLEQKKEHVQTTHQAAPCFFSFRFSFSIFDSVWTRPHTCSGPCAFEEKERKKETRNPAAPKTHHEIHSSPATATTSRRLATKHVPRLSPYSPASINSGFEEIGLVQLPQSIKTTNATHTQQTDRLINNGTLYAPRYEKAFLPNGLGRFGRFASSALSLY